MNVFQTSRPYGTVFWRKNYLMVIKISIELSTMCKIVFHSLLNFTHITQLRFLFVPNPKVVSYRP